jgi:hypothetical protein
MIANFGLRIADCGMFRNRNAETGNRISKPELGYRRPEIDPAEYRRTNVESR